MKLKASIGPQIGALSLLLHLESLEQHAIGNRDSTDALRLLGLLSTQVEQLAALTRARVATKDDIQHHAQLLESLSRRMDSIAQSMDENLRMVEPAATNSRSMTCRAICSIFVCIGESTLTASLRSTHV